MKKIFFSVFAAVCLVFMISSCGSGERRQSSSDDSSEYSENGSTDGEDTEDGDASEAESSDGTTFNNAQDVYAYLSGKTFESDGYTIQVRPDAIYMNGQAFTGAVEVEGFNGSQATVRAVNPSSNDIIELQVDADSGTLTDNSGEEYTLQ